MSTTTFNPTVFMSRAFEKAAAQSATDFSIAVIHALADKYGFDAKEAMTACQLSEIKVRSQRIALRAKVKYAPRVRVKQSQNARFQHSHCHSVVVL